MITEKDLQEAIAECQGVRNPNAEVCKKLAAYLVIQEHMYGGRPDAPSDGTALTAYSHAASEPVEAYISYDGSSEFAQEIAGRRAAEVWPVIDELMTVLQATNPRLYAGVMRKIQG